MRKTKIICTIGPASNNEEIFTKLVQEGVNVARFNFSHGTHDQQRAAMDMVKAVRKKLQKNIAILLDTKGPEIRLGAVAPETFLKEGSNLLLTQEQIEGNSEKCYITYENLSKTVKVGDKILLDDGMLGLRVTKILDKDVQTVVEFGGLLGSNKGVNIPGVKIELPAITEKDYSDIIFGLSQDIDFIAASFIRKAEDVLEIRKVLEDNNHSEVQIISKIESQEGYENLDAILAVSDGIMIARGDLGVEIPIEEVPIAQKTIIKKCNTLAKPVVTATQMLDSMIRNPSPTRAEATDVANAIFDGTDAIMLSGETAAGKYPVKSVRTMATIAKHTENSIAYKTQNKDVEKHSSHDNVTFAVSKATVETAALLDARAVVLVTSSGFTARHIAMHAPESPIIAITPTKNIARRLSIVRGVKAIASDMQNIEGDIFEQIERIAEEQKVVENGDLVVISAGLPAGVAGTTNLMKVSVIGAFVQKGIGIGGKKHSGIVKVINSLEDARMKIQEGDIVCSNTLDESYMQYLQKAGGIVSESNYYTSFAAYAGRKLDIPTVIGIKSLHESIVDGMEITINAKLGLIHNTCRELG